MDRGQSHQARDESKVRNATKMGRATLSSRRPVFTIARCSILIATARFCSLFSTAYGIAIRLRRASRCLARRVEAFVPPTGRFAMQYAPDEKVLCYHGPLMYQAKVRSTLVPNPRSSWPRTGKATITRTVPSAPISSCTTKAGKRRTSPPLIQMGRVGARVASVEI